LEFFSSIDWNKSNKAATQKKGRVEIEYNWDVIAKQTAELYHGVAQIRGN
jgi:hypothetical protein